MRMLQFHNLQYLYVISILQMRKNPQFLLVAMASLSEEAILSEISVYNFVRVSFFYRVRQDGIERVVFPGRRRQKKYITYMKEVAVQRATMVFSMRDGYCCTSVRRGRETIPRCGGKKVRRDRC